MRKYKLKNLTNSQIQLAKQFTPITSIEHLAHAALALHSLIEKENEDMENHFRNNILLAENEKLDEDIQFLKNRFEMYLKSKKIKKFQKGKIYDGFLIEKRTENFLSCNGKNYKIYIDNNIEYIVIDKRKSTYKNIMAN